MSWAFIGSLWLLWGRQPLGGKRRNEEPPAPSWVREDSNLDWGSRRKRWGEAGVLLTDWTTRVRGVCVCV